MNFGGGDGGGGYSTRSVTVTTTEYVYGTFNTTTTFWVPDEVEVWDPHLDMWVTVDQGGYQSETHTHSYGYPVTTTRTVQVPMDDGVADEPVDESAGWRSWLSIGVDFIPVVGNIKSAIDAATGRDFIAGEDLGALERAAATAGIFAGGLSKTAAKGAMAGAVAVTEAVARRAAGAAKRGPFRSKLSAKGATPNVSDPGLQNLVDDLYKGARRPNHVGTGSTADAVRNELATGLPTHGRFTQRKRGNTLTPLRSGYAKNPNASHHDRLAAQSMLDDLNSALEGP